MIILCLIFLGTAKLFCIAAASFYISASGAQGFQYLYILTDTSYFLCFCFGIIAIVMGMNLSSFLVQVLLKDICFWKQNLLLRSLFIFVGPAANIVPNT